MSLDQYVNRTVDVCAYQGGLVGHTLLRQQLLESAHGGTLCTGVQKLVQKFLLLLLTERGSITHFPLRGTTFLAQVRQGSLRTTLDISAAFSEAADDIRQQLLGEQLETDPDDERLDSAELVSVEVSGTSARITARLHTVSGATTAFIVPINAVI